MKTTLRTTLFALTVGMGGWLLLAAYAEQILEAPMAAAGVAREAVEIAYAGTLSDHYQIDDAAFPVQIRVLESPHDQSASVVVNRQEVMRFRSALDGLPPLLRAKQAASRLFAFLSAKGDARLIRPAIDGEQVLIRVGDETLTPVDDETAILSKNEPKHLALVWSNLLRKTLGAGTLLLNDSKKSADSEIYIDPSAYKPAGEKRSGIASWYGPGFHGRRCADGSRFNMYALTAAHRTLPFGTLVRVLNKRNGKSVVVRITDRGPFIHGRTIDLSKGAAQALQISGVAPVVLEVLARNAGFRLASPQIQKAPVELSGELAKAPQPSKPADKPVENIQDKPSTDETTHPTGDEIIAAPAVEEEPAAKAPDPENSPKEDLPDSDPLTLEAPAADPAPLLQ